MHRAALLVLVWAALAAAVASLAALARPDTGPPMPTVHAARSIAGALVPEREVKPTTSQRAPAPDELSGTVAPAVPPGPAGAPSGEAAPAGASPGTRDQGGAAESGAPQAQGAPSRAASPGAQPPAGARTPPAQDDGEYVNGLGVLPRGVPAEEEGLGVHVVRADGRLVPDAQVRWAQQSDLDAMRERGVAVDTLDPADLLAQSQRAARTNAGGFAILTSERGTMVVDARAGDQYGWARIRREDTGHVRIVLHRDTTLTVVTADRGGRALGGIGVVLRTVDGRTVWTGRTSAPDGRATLRHADAAVAALHARYQDLTVAVDAPGSAQTVLARGQIPVEPVLLEAAPGAVVRVLVLDAQGRPCSEPGTVRLEPNGLTRGPTFSERALRDGGALFDNVPTGAALVARARTGCGPDEAGGMLVAPSEVGAEATLTLRHAALMPRAAGRLLNPSGGPWREFDVTLYVLRAGGAWEAQGRAATDQDGAFRVTAPARQGAGRPLTATLVATNPWGRTVASEPFELREAETSVVQELGDVPARDWPVLLRGSVLDEHDRPLEEAAVELLDESGAKPVADVRTRVLTDERGQFALRGPASTSETVLVRATEPDQRATQADVALRRGDRAARIVIAVWGRLAGRVLVPEGASPSNVVVRVVPPSGAELALSASDDGTFAFSNVEPGECRLLFQAQGFEAGAVPLERVYVPRGGAPDDARLGAVDLRGAFRLFEADVVDERGEPIASGWVGPVGDGRTRGRGLEADGGKVRVLVPNVVTEVQVFVPGYEPAVVPVGAARARVELKPQEQ